MRKISLIVTACVILAACGGSSDAGTNPASVQVVGSYTLKTFNGATLPAVASQTAASKVEVVDDLFTLNADHTFSEIGHERVTTASGVSLLNETDLGSYGAVNGAVVFTSSLGNGTTNATISGNTLTVVAAGLVAVYQRN